MKQSRNAQSTGVPILILGGKMGNSGDKNNNKSNSKISLVKN